MTEIPRSSSDPQQPRVDRDRQGPAHDANVRLSIFLEDVVNEVTTYTRAYDAYMGSSYDDAISRRLDTIGRLEEQYGGEAGDTPVFSRTGVPTLQRRLSVLLEQGKAAIDAARDAPASDSETSEEGRSRDADGFSNPEEGLVEGE